MYFGDHPPPHFHALYCTSRAVVDIEPLAIISGGLRTDQAKRLKDLEKENAQLKRLLADAELDKGILREAASGCRRRAQLNF